MEELKRVVKEASQEVLKQLQPEEYEMLAVWGGWEKYFQFRLAMQLREAYRVKLEKTVHKKRVDLLLCNDKGDCLLGLELGHNFLSQDDLGGKSLVDLWRFGQDQKPCIASVLIVTWASLDSECRTQELLQDHYRSDFDKMLRVNCPKKAFNNLEQHLKRYFKEVSEMARRERSTGSWLHPNCKCQLQTSIYWVRDLYHAWTLEHDQKLLKCHVRATTDEGEKSISEIQKCWKPFGRQSKGGT